MNTQNFKKNFSRWCIGVGLILSFIVVAVIVYLVYLTVDLLNGAISVSSNQYASNEIDEMFMSPVAIFLIIFYAAVKVLSFLVGTAWLGSIVTFICMKKLKRNWTIPAIITLVLVIAQLLTILIGCIEYLGLAIGITLVFINLWFIGWLVAICIYIRETSVKKCSLLATIQQSDDSTGRGTQ